MPWNSGGPSPWGPPGGSPGGGGGQGGGNGQPPRGPWGSGGGGRGGGPGQMPDFDAIIARLQAMIRNWMPRGGATGSRGLALIAIALVALWLASGFYRVQPDEQGLVLRFGAYDRSTLPGLNYHIPWPVESVELLAVTRINRTEIGFRTPGDGGNTSGRSGALREVPEESLMLTGDENIIDINFAVFWRINNGVDYLFNIRDPDVVVKAVAESVMREVVGLKTIDGILTSDRKSIEPDVQSRLQKVLNDYHAGVLVLQVQLQSVDVPSQVLSAYRDVTAAQQDQQRAVNDAYTYSNKVKPEAEGAAARIRLEAQAYRQQTVAEATGQTSRFNQVYEQYKNAPGVTRERMYLETMERVLGAMDKTILDTNGVGPPVPYLSLDALQHKPAGAAK